MEPTKRVIEGCNHPVERMTEWADQGACPICLTAECGMLKEQLAEVKKRGKSWNWDWSKIVSALSRKAQQLQADASNHELFDIAELLRVLSRLLSGQDPYSAFGAPGDWGYETSIGDALRAVYKC